MPVNGAYEFKRAVKGDSTGLVTDENHISIGEWAWIKFKIECEDKTEKDYLLIYLRDPDCRELSTLWRRFGEEVKGHQIDGQGNVHPSVWHQFPLLLDGNPPVERCGFHSHPTKLLDFVDIR